MPVDSVDKKILIYLDLSLIISKTLFFHISSTTLIIEIMSIKEVINSLSIICKVNKKF